MKKIWKCLKEIPLGYKIFYFITFLIYIVSYIFFFRSLLYLEDIETVIRYVVLFFFGIFGIFYLIVCFKKISQRKKGLFIFLSILAILFSIVFGVSAFVIDKLYHKIAGIEASDTSVYTSVILTLKDTEFNQSSVIGMVTDEEDRTGYILPNEWIKKENITNEIDYRSSTLELLKALYEHEVDAIFITKDYAVLYGGDDVYQNILSETKVVKEYSKEMKNEESEILATTKSLKEPFTVLILGVDSESQNGLDVNAAFNGDTLIVVTFNPKTLVATMLSIPRDMYVPIYSSSGSRRGYGKINSSAALGTAATVETIEHMTNLDIDYFVKVNFRGVVDLVESIGGIDVDVEPPDYNYYIQSWGEGRLCEQDSLRNFQNMICMNTGMQHLNGEQALAYARNRHGYLESDVARNRHQQQVLEAVAKKVLHSSSLSDFEHLLDTVSNNIATNMKTSQILSFYQAIKGMLKNALSGEEFITIQKTQLSYYSLDVNGYSCLGYYQGSMDAITKAMKENLGLLSVETIKTFGYDYSEDYEQSSKVIGKGIYSGERLRTLPDFRGSSVSEAQSFASQNHLTVNIDYRSDENEIPGIILDQSVAAGTLTNQFSSFTIYVNKIDDTKKPDEDDETEDPDEENETNENKPSTSKPNTGSTTPNETTPNPTTPTEPTPQTPTVPEESTTPTIPGEPTEGNEGSTTTDTKPNDDDTTSGDA